MRISPGRRKRLIVSLLGTESESNMVPLADVVGNVEAIGSDLFAALFPDRE